MLPALVRKTWRDDRAGYLGWAVGVGALIGVYTSFYDRFRAAAELKQQAFPPEMLDVILHHHEFLDGTGYPDGLSGKEISDIVRLTTIVDIYAAMVEKRAYRLQFTHAKAFAMMEEMGDKLDQHLLHAFRPVAFGHY